uniref:Sterile alpha motif domain containing 11 n=1 Tax=Cairina moschata TaxID=8855 RepID=A0A8C3BTR8_CAIMO
MDGEGGGPAVPSWGAGSSRVGELGVLRAKGGWFGGVLFCGGVAADPFPLPRSAPGSARGGGGGGGAQPRRDGSAHPLGQQLVQPEEETGAAPAQGHPFPRKGDIPPAAAALAPERAPYRPGAPLETSFPRGAFGPVPDTRLEMSAEIIRQKELENLHRQRLLAGDPLSLHPGLPPDHPALRNVHDIPEGHPLREELSRRNAMLVLRHNNAPLLSLNPGVPSSATPPKEQPRRGSRKAAQHRAEPQGPSEAKEAAEPRGARDGAPDCNDEEMKDSESDADVSDEKPESLKAESSGSAAELKECKEAGKGCEGAKELGEGAAGTTAPCSSSSAESPSHLLGPGINKSEVKYLPPASIPPPQPLPFGFPYTMSPYFHAGTMGGLFLDGEESPALEDISKWTVEDVCSFVSNLSGCTEYTQVKQPPAPAASQPLFPRGVHPHGWTARSPALPVAPSPRELHKNSLLLVPTPKAKGWMGAGQGWELGALLLRPWGRARTEPGGTNIPVSSALTRRSDAGGEF